jgi:hypothetical protein
MPRARLAQVDAAAASVETAASFRQVVLQEGPPNRAIGGQIARAARAAGTGELSRRCSVEASALFRQVILWESHLIS